MRKSPLPVTEWLAQTVLVLPTGANVSIQDIERACALILFVIETSVEIWDELRRRNLRFNDTQGGAGEG